MAKIVFINVPTKNVAAAREFYSKLGFEINEAYSSEQNVFVVINESVQLIVAAEDFLKQQGETREFADTTKTTEASVAIMVDSRKEVDALFDAAVAAGGKQAGEAVEQAEIGLYSRGFTDLDGHRFTINHMAG